MRTHVYFLFALIMLILSLGRQDAQSSPLQQTVPGDRTIYLPVIVDTFSCDAVEEIPKSECQALEEFYYATNDRFSGGEGWTYNGNWFSNTFPCSWWFVGCETGHVVRIETGGNNLTGSVPAAIANLPQLQQLYLAQNALTSLPSEIGQLSNLHSLDVSYNQLSTLPSEIGEMVNLERLELGANALTELPDSIGGLANLRRANLFMNQLTTLPPQIGQLRNLEYLSVWDNSLTTLPPEIGNLSALQEMELSVNNLTALPDEIGSLVNLKHAAFSRNQLRMIPASIGQLSNLCGLGLSNNQLTTLPHELINVPISPPPFCYLDVSSNCLTNLADAELIAFLDAKSPWWRTTQRTDCQ